MVKLNAEHGLGTGLGDCVMMSWFPECRFFTTNKNKQNLFTLLQAEWDDNQDYMGRHVEPAFHKDLPGLKNNIPRIQSWREALGLGEWQRPMANIGEQAMEWALTVTRRHKSPIMLFPKSNVKSREWPANYWIELAWKLKGEGEYPIIMLPEADRVFKNTPSVWHGYSFEMLSALMMMAKLVVSNDSFPAHLAGTLDVPTLVLAGPTTKYVFSHMPSVETIASKRMDCVGCCFHSPFRAACDVGCLALYSMFPDDVLEEIMAKLNILSVPASN